MTAASRKRADEPPFGSFEETHAEFECRFTELFNQRGSNVWVFDSCRYEAEGDSCRVRCEFEEA